MKYNLCHLNILLWFGLIVSNCLSQKARPRKRALSKEAEMASEQGSDSNAPHIYKVLDRLRLQALAGKARECESHLRAEANASRDWRCHVHAAGERHFCLCGFEYACGATQRLFLSREYAARSRKANRLLNVRRGADWQCEQALASGGRPAAWTCALFSNANATSAHEQLYCKCAYQDTCLHERVVDFF